MAPGHACDASAHQRQRIVCLSHVQVIINRTSAAMLTDSAVCLACGLLTCAVQVLECESVSHLTATSNLCFTSGKHCWQFVVTVPCDLVWLGLSDGSLTPDVWGGKQPGGWFYGSNDVSLSVQRPFV